VGQVYLRIVDSAWVYRCFSKGYDGVMYLRASYESTAVSVRLVAVKTRVATLHTLNIPRLELCGLLLTANLLTATSKDVGIPQSMDRFLGGTRMVVCPTGKFEDVCSNPSS